MTKEAINEGTIYRIKGDEVNGAKKFAESLARKIIKSGMAAVSFDVEDCPDSFIVTGPLGLEYHTIKLTSRPESIATLNRQLAERAVLEIHPVPQHLAVVQSPDSQEDEE